MTKRRTPMHSSVTHFACEKCAPLLCTDELIVNLFDH